MEQPTQWTQPRATASDKVMFWAALLVGAVLLLAVPRNKPVWTDELTVIQNAARPLAQLLSGQADNHQPPLYPVYIHAIIAFFGQNLAAVRIASALPGIVVLVYVHRLASRFCPSAAVAAVWLAALSPSLVLYQRMACDHALVAALATAGTFYFLNAVEQGRPIDFVVYFLCMFLMLVTSYLCLFLLIAQGFGLLLRLFILRDLTSFNVLLCQLGAAVMFFPWFYSDFSATADRSNPAIIEDATISLGLHGFVRRIGLPAYVHLVGETVYPWAWVAVIVAALAASITLVIGIRALLQRPEWILPLSSFTVVILAAVVTSTSAVGADQSVGYMGKRVMFVIPLYYVVLAAGYSAVSHRLFATLLLTSMLSVNVYSVTNYWLGEQFLNPAYVARWDTVVQIMQTRGLNNAAAPTVVFSPDPALAWYLAELSPPVPVQMDDDIDALLARNNLSPTTIAASEPAATPPAFAWVVIRDRGNRLAFSEIDQLRQQLAAHYPMVSQFGVMPRSPAELFWMKQIFNRDADPDYITLQLYDLTKPLPATTQPGNDANAGATNRQAIPPAIPGS